MTDAQINETLAKAVGFKLKHDGKTYHLILPDDLKDSQTPFSYWVNPEDRHINELPDFLNDFNACLKWFEPHFWITKMDKLDGIFYVFELSHPENPNSPVRGPAEETVARAFCMAYLKYLEDKEK